MFFTSKFPISFLFFLYIERWSNTHTIIPTLTSLPQTVSSRKALHISPFPIFHSSPFPLPLCATPRQVNWMRDEFLSWMLQSLSPFVGPVEVRKLIVDAKCGDEVVSSAHAFVQTLRQDWDPRLYVLTEALEAHASNVGYGGATVATLGLLLANELGTAEERGEVVLELTDAIGELLDAAEQRVVHIARHCFTAPEALVGGTREAALHSEALWGRLLGTPPSQSKAAAEVAAVVAAVPGAGVGVGVMSPPDYVSTYCPARCLHAHNCVVLPLRRPDKLPLHKPPPEYPLFLGLKTLLVRSLRGCVTTTQGGKLEAQEVHEGEASLRGGDGVTALAAAVRALCVRHAIRCVMVAEIDVDVWDVWEVCAESGILVIAETTLEHLQTVSTYCGVQPCLSIDSDGSLLTVTDWEAHCAVLQYTTLCSKLPSVVGVRAEEGRACLAQGAVFVSEPVKEWLGVMKDTATRCLRRRGAMWHDIEDEAQPGLVPGGGFVETVLLSLLRIEGKDATLAAAQKVLTSALTEYLHVLLCNQGLTRPQAIETLSACSTNVTTWVEDCDRAVLRALAGGGDTTVPIAYPTPPLLCTAEEDSEPGARLPATQVTHWESFRTRLTILRHALILAQTLATMHTFGM